MKIYEFINLNNKHKKTSQDSSTFKKKALKEFGLTPKKFLNLDIKVPKEKKQDGRK